RRHTRSKRDLSSDVCSSDLDFFRLNRRMHNKSLTVDGVVSVVGGRNIGDEYFDAATGVAFADLDVAVVGNVVTAISGAFNRYWKIGRAWCMGRVWRQVGEG